MDLFRRLLRHFLDLHSPFGRSNQAITGGLPVKSDGQVEFPGDLHRLFHQYPPHPESLRAGLRRYQLPAKQLFPRSCACSGWWTSFTPPPLPRPPA